MTNSIRKGKAFERLVANLLKEVWPEAKRGLSQTRDGAECADVEVPKYWIECKKWKAFTQADKVAAFEQARLASFAREGKIPVVIWQRHNSHQITCSTRLHWAAGIFCADDFYDLETEINPLVDFSLDDFIAAVKEEVGK